MKQTTGVYTLLLLAGTLLFSCRSTKPIVRTHFPAADSAHIVKDSSSNEEAVAFNRNLLSKIRERHIDYTTFSAKLKVDFENEKQSHQNVNTVIRMKKDSLIWISVSFPVLGEVARAIITPDSLKAYDKFNKRLYLRALSDAQDVLNIPFDFKTLQDLIIGNPVFLTDSVYQVVKTPAIISFSCDSSAFTSLFNVFADDYVLQQSKVMDKGAGQQRSCELTYGEYKDAGGYKFATRRRLFVEEKNITRIAMEFNKVEFNQSLSFPFTVPTSGYSLQ
ncbi:DUF4292 domain-containing protein [Chitinophaga pendula]|uniref:DUF4292 domain-containing protein n=1 Tax=Chitinophaga TaxID=79328 RepID=UPI000BB040AA|nr:MULTISPECIES: DUF4292 domain-containing protein [Chitinophaga]ASZ10794.1 hypothetical protein CK934_07290 [Chitinophaga sp. MD30]UCJ06227.1 DUF4292 domain-containing protein [Chitinophaga pendula]